MSGSHLSVRVLIDDLVAAKKTQVSAGQTKFTAHSDLLGNGAQGEERSECGNKSEDEHS